MKLIFIILSLCILTSCSIYKGNQNPRYHTSDNAKIIANSPSWVLWEVKDSCDTYIILDGIDGVNLLKK